MKGKTEMTEETINIEATEGCAACLSVPISHLAIEEGIEVPLGGWQSTFDQMNITTLVDPAGRLAISTLAARRLFSAIKRRNELFVEDAQRRTEKLAKKYPRLVGGLPVVEGATPYESMVAAGGVVSPQDEFQGIPRPRFLQEELAEGERALAEKKRLAAERAKERLVDQARRALQ